MFKYIRGEFYRIRHKKSLYIWLAVAAAIAALPVLGGGSLSGDAGIALQMLFPMTIGAFLFTTIYTDDLNSKKLTTLIGFGLGRVKIFFSKMIIMAILTAFVFAAAAAVMCAFGAVLNGAISADDASDVFLAAFQGFLCVIAFSTLASIAVYGTQKAIPAVAAYIVLATTIVSQLLMAFARVGFIARIAPDLPSWFAYNSSQAIAYGISAGAVAIGDVAKYAAYVAICAALAVLAFGKKELEF